MTRDVLDKKMQDKRILFLGTHGQFNIGDELLLETFLAQLGPDNLYFVNSYDPAFTTAQLRPRHRVEVFHTAGERSRFLRYLWACDLLFFGGGSIIKELYASVGRNPYSTLLMVLATVTFAKRIARKPIVMSNIGVGPLHTARGRQLAGWILRQVDVLSVRDATSYRTCLELGLPAARVRQVPDAVFVNQPEFFVDQPDEAPPPADRLRVALNLNYDIENPANWTTFLQNLEDGLRAAHAVRPLEVHTLPMQSRFKEQNDWKILAEFRARIPEIDVIQHRPETYREAAAIIAGCAILVSERLHAIVMAATLGKPLVALMYDVKVRELVASLGMEAYALDINHPFDPLALQRSIATVQQESTAIRDHLLQRSAVLRRELEAYFQGLLQGMDRRERT